MFLGQIKMDVRMLEKKDVYTRGHSNRLAVYAVKTAVQMGYTGEVLDQIRLGGELHDIGKIGTRDEVLNKPGPLTPDEFEEIKKHVVEGEEILEPLRREHPLVLDIVRSHHERIDGTGFPDRRRSAIPRSRAWSRWPTRSCHDHESGRPPVAVGRSVRRAGAVRGHSFRRPGSVGIPARVPDLTASDSPRDRRGADRW
jgi:putative nucleotidyltransferase with HDIG domain